ncbi:hypothetical protein GCM10025298_00070 [Natronobiforma cellulositropha]
MIARVDLRRSRRALVDDPARFVSVLIVGLLLIPLGLAAVGGAYGLGRAFGDDLQTAVPYARSLVLPGVGVLASIVLFYRLTVGPLPDHPTLPLTSTTTRAVVVAALLTSVAVLVLWVLAPLLVLSTAFSLGAGTVALPIGLAVWLVPLTAVGATSGYLCSLWLARIDRRLRIPRWLKILGWFLLTVALFLGWQAVASGSGHSLLESGYRLLSEGVVASTAGAYADALVLTAGIVSSPDRLAVSGGVSLLFLATAAVAFTRSVANVEHLWFDDETRTDAVAVSRPPARAPAPLAWSQSGRFAWHYLLLARRAPRRLVHLTMLVFFLFPLLSFAYSAPGRVLEFAPTVGVLACALVTGASFCLNPLGDERGALPAILLSSVDATYALRGRILAGFTLGVVPLALGALAGVGSGVDPASVVWLVVLGVALSLAAGGVACGLGTLVPKFEPDEVYGVETVRPSHIPLIGFELGTLVVLGVGLWLLGAPSPEPATVLETPLPYVLYAAFVAASGVLGYLGAARTLRGYTV